MCIRDRHYTYRPEEIHYSITQDEDPDAKPFSRFSAYAFLVGGYAISLGIGLFIGWHAQDFFSDLTLLFRHHVPTVAAGGAASTTALIISDLLFYPPIAVLIVDTMHAVASRIDAGQ